MRFGHNKATRSVAIGGELVLVRLDQHSQLGVVTQLNEQYVTVRLIGNREPPTSIGICTPVTPDMDSAADRGSNKVGDSFTHFVSLEFEPGTGTRNS